MRSQIGEKNFELIFSIFYRFSALFPDLLLPILAAGKELVPLQTSHYNAAGRQIYKPSAQQRRNVQAMAVSGIPPLDIAKHLGLAPKLLRDHFRKVLDRRVIPPLTSAQEQKYKAPRKASKKLFRAGRAERR